METIQSINLIAINPKVRSGRPYIVGTTLEVSVIAIAKIVHMRSPEEIAVDYGVSLTQVYAALAYYYDHKAEIDATIEERRKLADEYKEKRVGSRIVNGLTSKSTG
jgi:uncharacterized protein (DUF433 family)